VVAVHSGWQLLGTPEHFVVPAALNAYSVSSVDPTWTTPFATAGDELKEPQGVTLLTVATVG
jgi:hypothetical protein